MTTARAPRFISPVAPLANPKMLSTNFGASVANSGKIKASMKAKGTCERKEEAKQEIAGQTQPTGLFHLPGVDPRNAEQAEEAHGESSMRSTIAHVLVVTDERTSGGWIGWMAMKMIPAAIADKPAQRMSFGVVIFILLSLIAVWRLVFASLPAFTDCGLSIDVHCLSPY